jgi:hypothetical protein
MEMENAQHLISRHILGLERGDGQIESLLMKLRAGLDEGIELNPGQVAWVNLALHDTITGLGPMEKLSSVSLMPIALYIIGCKK